MYYIVLIFFITYFITMFNIDFCFFRRDINNENNYLDDVEIISRTYRLSVATSYVGSGFAIGLGIMALLYRFS